MNRRIVVFVCALACGTAWVGSNDAIAQTGASDRDTNDDANDAANTNDDAANTNDDAANTNDTSDTNDAANVRMSATEETLDEAPRRAPRVATVLVGDPDPIRRARAADLDARLGALGLQRLGDPAMRAALLGESREDDGLERLHAARRRLLFEDDPTAALRDLGARLRVDALVVVRASDPARIAVFDVSAGAFYEDEPTLADLDAAAAFVRRAARAASRRASAPSPAAVASAASTPSPSEPTEPEAAPRSARRWLKANWAYIVGGALLVGAITGFIVRGRRNDEDPPPILRFRPGLE